MSIYKEVRICNELTVREMAEIMGVSQALYRMYESGDRNPKEIALRRFYLRFPDATKETYATIAPTPLQPQAVGVLMG